MTYYKGTLKVINPNHTKISLECLDEVAHLILLRMQRLEDRIIELSKEVSELKEIKS
jgi:hypothetical protein